MAAMSMLKNVLRLNSTNNKILIPTSVSCNVKRWFYRRDPEEEIERLYITQSLAQRLDEMKNSTTVPKVIGRQQSPSHSSKSESDCSRTGTTGHFKRRNGLKTQLAKLSDNDSSNNKPASALSSRLDGPLALPLSVMQQNYLNETDSAHAVGVLSHYGVFRDLFNDNVILYPDPALQLRIAYSLNSSVGESEEVLPIFRGNKVEPVVTAEFPPLFSYIGNPDKYYSLLYVNLDGHLFKPSGQYLHWSCGMLTCAVI